MSAPVPPRASARAVALGALAVVALGVAAVLARGGALGAVKTVLGCTALLVLPGWLVGRLVDDEGDAVVRLAVGAMTTLGACALLGFLAALCGLRVATIVYAAPLCVLVALVAVLGGRAPAVPRAALAPVALALALGAVALGAAAAAHLALPAVPVEPSFTLASSSATATPKGVSVTVTVSEVRSAGPASLELVVGRTTSTTTVAPGARIVHLHVALRRGAPCPTLVRVLAPNGAYLSPPVTCTGA